MISEKLKRFIFNKLYSDLSTVEVIELISPMSNNISIWFIDRDKEFWIIEIKDNGTMWWRADFFNDVIYLFSLTEEQFESVLCDWVKEVMKNRFFNFYSNYEYRLNERGEWYFVLSLNELKYSKMITNVKKRNSNEVLTIPFKYLDFITKDCSEFIKPKIYRAMPDDNSLSESINDIVNHCYPSNSSDNT